MTQESALPQHSLKVLGLIFIVVPIAILLVSRNSGSSDSSAGALTAAEEPNTYPDTPAGQVQRMEDVVAMAPTIPSLINLGLAYFNNGQFVESINTNKRVLELDGTQVVALNNTCAAYNRLDDYFKAQLFCDKALKIDPTSTLAVANMKEAKDREARIKSLLQDEQSHKLAVSEALELGMYFYKIKKFSRAVEIFDKGLALEPRNALLLNNACSSLCEQKLWDEAVVYCERALQVDPNYDLAKGNLAWARNGQAGLIQ